MGRVVALLLALGACGTAAAGPEDLSFEIRRVHLGHASAAVLVVDQDGDGNPDILVAGGSGVTVLKGDGSGAFGPPVVVPAGDHPVDLAEGDLDGDGRLDVVVANHDTHYVTLLFGGASGLADGRSERLPVEVSPHPHAVAVRDVDGDGHLDILIDDRDQEALRVLLGLGDGSFRPGPPVAVGGDPYRGMTLADVNGDGHVDVVTPNPGTVAVQLGDGGGAFTPGAILGSGDVPPFSTAVGDFDGDGVVDVAAGSGEGPGAVRVWLGRGDGYFEVDPGSPYTVAEGPTALGTADVDGDGIDDVLVTSWMGNELAVVLGGRERRRVVRIELEGNPWGVAAGDLDGDGRTDLVTAHGGGEAITVLLGRSADSRDHGSPPGP